MDRDLVFLNPCDILPFRCLIVWTNITKLKRILYLTSVNKIGSEMPMNVYSVSCEPPDSDYLYRNAFVLPENC